MMEKLLQYVWQHRLWEGTTLMTNDGRKVRVIDPGLLNTDSGPDFFNAKVEIDDEMWVGNVEIHIRASDWKRHKHDLDMAYDSVILHVVEKDDAPVFRSNGQRIPQCEMHVSPHFNERYNELMRNDSELPCASGLKNLTRLEVTEWTESLAFERLHSKVDRLEDLLESFRGSWEDVCYVTLARNLGFGINNDAFERLARRMPLRLMQKHCDSLLQVEALLFGQAGMLNPIFNPKDDYYQNLCTEYAFLASKFSLKPMDESNWKFFRVRPQNFPHRRIALLAEYVHGGFRLFADILDCKDEKELRELLNIELKGYWTTHYSFGKPSPVGQKSLSNSSLNIILINTIAPLYYAYGESIDSYEMTEKAVKLLESLPAERNSIVTRFGDAGLKADNALMSQALIQLRREYCESRKCIFCKLGHRMLSKAASE